MLDYIRVDVETPRLDLGWGVSSKVEHSVHIREVRGSSPLLPTESSFGFEAKGIYEVFFR